MKRIMFYALTLCALPLWLVSCAQTKEFTEQNIVGEWSIVNADGFNAADEETLDTPFLGFNLADRRLYGSTGCNNVIKVRKLRLKGDNLMLTDEDGNVLITLTRRSAATR